MYIEHRIQWVRRDDKGRVIEFAAAFRTFERIDEAMNDDTGELEQVLVNVQLVNPNTVLPEDARTIRYSRIGTPQLVFDIQGLISTDAEIKALLDGEVAILAKRLACEVAPWQR